MTSRTYNVSLTELDAAGIDYRLYARRREEGKSHNEALTPRRQYSREPATVVVPPTYSIRDHIRARRMHNMGMSPEGLHKEMPYIPVGTLESIVQGVNYLMDED